MQTISATVAITGKACRQCIGRVLSEEISGAMGGERGKVTIDREIEQSSWIERCRLGDLKRLINELARTLRLIRVAYSAYTKE